MPQVKEPLLRLLVKEALKEAEGSFGPDNTKFKIGVDVGNPQSETKLGLRIKLRPSEGFLEPDKKGELEAAIMKKMNNSLEQFDIQISKDTDVPDPEVMGFFIPLPQLKNMIVKSLGGQAGKPSPSPEDIKRSAPKADIDSLNKLKSMGDKEDLEEQEDPLDRAARLAKEPLPGMSKMTGLGMKRSQYGEEEGGELTLEELFEKLGTAYDLLVDVFKDIYKSDYKFKTYYENNEDEITRTMGAIAMMKDDVMLVNTSRGGIIDEIELYNGLKNGVYNKAGVNGSNLSLGMQKITIILVHLYCLTMHHQNNFLQPKKS